MPQPSAPLQPAVASLVRRTVAGVIDVLILGSISAAVVVLTLRVCELTLEQWAMLPAVPMLAFLMLLCGGYFVLFTVAGGQTIGKMAAHIRVVNGPEVTAGSRVVQDRRRANRGLPRFRAGARRGIPARRDQRGSLRVSRQGG